MSVKSKDKVKIFINHVDEYHGIHIGKFLSKCVVGASLEEEEEEEEDVEESQPNAGDGVAAEGKEGCYEVYGTVRKSDSAKPDFVKQIISNNSREELYNGILECDIIIYDITQFPDQIEESMWILSELHFNMEQLEKRKTFILLSTIMTWARSNPADEDDPEAALTEEDYKKRKAHPNFKEHILAEKTTVKYGKTRKSRLLTYIVATGLTYGCGENIFHSFFKAAWHNALSLPVYGNGQNMLPMVHVLDLAAVLQNICDSKPKIKYLLALDDSQGQTQEAVVKSIADVLANGKLRNVTKEEAILSNQIDEQTLDMLTVSIRLDANYIKDNFQINWVCEAGIVESTKQIVREYKTQRGLLPIKLCVLGPPAVGKSTLVRLLCQHYRLHHVAAKDVIDQAIDALERSAARADDEEEDDDGKAADDAETLEQVKESMSDNDGRLADEFVIKFFRQKLSSKPCQNQGFILDGFPRTKEEAEALFGPDDEEEEEEEDNDEGEDEGSESKLNRKVLPDQIFILEAEDKFLKDRVMQLSECEVEGTHNTEEGLIRRLTAYRRRVENDESAAEFFEVNELQPQYVQVAGIDKELIADTVKELVGEPRNYGLTPEQIQEIQRKQEEARLAEEQRVRDEIELRQRKEAELRQLRQEEWTKRLESLRQQEQQQLEQRSEPLRNYLLTHVMPCLANGLRQCATEKPDDAVDYLAEFLFRNNPQID